MPNAQNNEKGLLNDEVWHVVAYVRSLPFESITEPSMGSEDFAFYCQQIPAAMFRLGRPCDCGIELLSMLVPRPRLAWIRSTSSGLKGSRCPSRGWFRDILFSNGNRQVATKKIFRVGVIGASGKGDYGHAIDMTFAGLGRAKIVAVADDHVLE